MENKNPFLELLRSRKFWVAVFDMLVSVALYLVGRLDPAHVEDVRFVIGALQPVFLILIGSIAYEDAKIQPMLARIEYLQSFEGKAAVERAAENIEKTEWQH